jgi:hypothetical protein
MQMTPQKRSMSQLKTFNPKNCTSKRKEVLVQGALIGDPREPTVGYVHAVIEGCPTFEPFLHPGKKEIDNKMGTSQRSVLIDAGFFFTATRVANENTDLPLRTVKHYDYKAFLVNSSENLQENNYAGLKRLLVIFADVSTFKCVPRVF